VNKHILAAAVLALTTATASADQWVPLYNAAGIETFKVSARPAQTIGYGWRTVWIEDPRTLEIGHFDTDCQGRYRLRFSYTSGIIDAVPPDSIAYGLETIACR
jgi:hypothetical protein